MNLPPLNLDDRRFDDLVEEAKRRIAAKCPGWTDFNPSDPGMMLVELMSWMTESVLYRLNRVPEQNYIKFLDLIGVRLQPARPARAWVFVQVKDKLDEEALPVIEQGAQVSTKSQGNQGPVAFVTSEALNLTTARIIHTCSRFRSSAPAGSGETLDEYEETHNFHGAHPWETEVFARSRKGMAVPHNLYLGDSALADPLLANYWSHVGLQVKVEVEQPSEGRLCLEWEAWDGDDWRIVIPEKDETEGLLKSGNIAFARLPAMKGRALSDLSDGQLIASQDSSGGDESLRWLRARLVGSTLGSLPVLRRVQRQLDLTECILAPRKAWFQTPAPQEQPKHSSVPLTPPPQQPLDLNAEFYPFGTKAMVDSAFYLSSELFLRKAASIVVQFKVSKGLVPKSKTGLVISWEYRTRNSWQPLTVSMPGEQDASQAFTASGQVTKLEFKCPDDVDQTEQDGRMCGSIRARVAEGEFENDADAQLILKSVLLRFANEVRDWSHILTENYSAFKQHPSEFAASPPAPPLKPFYFEARRDPAFYLCLNLKPSASRGPHRLFLDVVPQVLDVVPKDLDRQCARFTWEYCTKDGHWNPLQVEKDGTQSFTHQGALEFISPRDWSKSDMTSHSTAPLPSGYWLRVRWEAAEFQAPPRLRRVLLNGVEVLQAVPASRVLGSSNGSPNQVFSLHASMLDSPEVWVRESEQSSNDARSRLLAQITADDLASRDASAGLASEVKAEVKRKEDGLPVDWTDGCWVKWREVRNFFNSKPKDRHFAVDLATGTFFFGDGACGRIPPTSPNNVATLYRVTEGSAGNVGHGTITVLGKGMANQVQGVTNVNPAGGGCDREAIEKAKQRGPWEIRHGNRAVTREDFKELAKKASQRVAKAECFEVGGIVNVIIIPDEQGDKPQPSRRLIESVGIYLDDKRLINVVPRVRGPDYEAVDAEVAIVLEPDSMSQFGEVSQKVEQKLRDFVHPLKGMQRGGGWVMGRTLHVSELYYQLEGIPGIDYVEKVRICRSGTGLWEEKIKIGSTSFPCFSSKMKILQSIG